MKPTVSDDVVERAVRRAFRDGARTASPKGNYRFPVAEDEAVERAIAALSTHMSVTDAWQPIETAPKDGTEIIVFKDIATVPVVHIAWYRSEKEWEESGQYCGTWDSLDEWLGWWSYTRNSVTQERLGGYAEPTHWMPLPEPPAIQSAHTEGEGQP